MHRTMVLRAALLLIVALGPNQAHAAAQTGTVQRPGEVEVHVSQIPRVLQFRLWGNEDKIHVVSVHPTLEVTFPGCVFDASQTPTLQQSGSLIEFEYLRPSTGGWLDNPVNNTRDHARVSVAAPDTLRIDFGVLRAGGHTNIATKAWIRGLFARFTLNGQCPKDTLNLTTDGSASLRASVVWVWDDSAGKDPQTSTVYPSPSGASAGAATEYFNGPLWARSPGPATTVELRDTVISDLRPTPVGAVLAAHGDASLTLSCDDRGDNTCSSLTALHFPWGQEVLLTKPMSIQVQARESAAGSHKTVTLRGVLQLK